MNDFSQFVFEHGASALFRVVLVEQAGLPLPAVPSVVRSVRNEEPLVQASPSIAQAFKAGL